MIRSELPPRAGVGFKPEHFGAIDRALQPLGFFEVHAENYMGAGGMPHAMLAKLRRDYALSIHGVGLSIGSVQPLDADHLARLKTLCDRYQPQSFSEHLAWSSHDAVYLNDLLPLPYTEETLVRVAEHVGRVQDALGRQMLLENPATYVQFEDSTIAETTFLAELVRRTGCGLLLDVNNVFVAATNHGLDPFDYLAAFPIHAVEEIHLGGHTVDDADVPRPLLLDTHAAPVAEPVWTLFRTLIAGIGPVASLIEWDDGVPEWPALLREAEAAQVLLDAAASTRVA